MRIECQDCSETIQVPSDAVSRRLKCPRCGARLAIAKPSPQNAEASGRKRREKGAGGAKPSRPGAATPTSNRKQAQSAAQSATNPKPRTTSADDSLKKQTPSPKASSQSRADKRLRAKQKAKAKQPANAESVEAAPVKRETREGEPSGVRAAPQSQAKRGQRKKRSRTPVVAAQPTWRMRTPDGDIYGPTSASELDEWVAEGRVDAACELSTDNLDWFPAEIRYPELSSSEPNAAFGSSDSAVPVVSAPPIETDLKAVASAEPATASHDSDVVALDVEALEFDAPDQVDSVAAPAPSHLPATSYPQGTPGDGPVGGERPGNGLELQWNNPPSLVKIMPSAARLARCAGWLLVMVTLLAAIPPVLAMSRLWVGETDPIQWPLIVHACQLALAMTCLLPALAAKPVARSATRFANAPCEPTLEKFLRSLMTFMRWALLALSGAAISILLSWILAGSG